MEWCLSGVRPGISVRILRAEVKSRFSGVSEYVLEAVDMHTGVFWHVKKRYKDFFQLRKLIKHMVRCGYPNGVVPVDVKYVYDLEFPRRRLRNVNRCAIEERRQILEMYCIHVSALDPKDETRANILYTYQNFLCSTDFVSSLEHIDTSSEENDDKWLKYDLYKRIFSACSLEAETCRKYIAAFRVRCENDDAKDALVDLRTALTQVGKHVRKKLHCRYTLPMQKDTIDYTVFRTVEDCIFVPLQMQVKRLVLHTISLMQQYKLETNIKLLFGKSQDAFGIPKALQSEACWGRACYLLKRMEDQVLPIDMLQNGLMASANCIFETCGVANAALTADEYLPIQIYVVVHAGLKNPLLIKELLGVMIMPDNMISEVGYFLTMFESALKFIHDMEIP